MILLALSKPVKTGIMLPLHAVYKVETKSPLGIGRDDDDLEL